MIDRLGLRRHHLALGLLALASLVWGAGFAVMKYSMQAGLSVGALLSLRFGLGSLAVGSFLVWRRKKFDQQSLLDGSLLGLLIVLIFWLQTDGLRFTTTAKSGFITGLYILFTPMVAMLLGDRLRPKHGFGALMAMAGLFLLVHEPGLSWGGWNRGDAETLACALFCGFHIALTAKYARRSDPWTLVFVQVLIMAFASTLLTFILPASPLSSSTPPMTLGGFQGTMMALKNPGVWACLIFLGLFSTVFGFWAQSSQQAYVTATEAALVFSLEPVFTAVLAVSGLFPGIQEQLRSIQWAGASLIFLAMFIAEANPRKRLAPERG